MVNGVRMKEQNNPPTNSFAKLRSFPGAKIKQLNYQAVPSLVSKIPNTVLIYRGCNDISNKTSTPANIAKTEYGKDKQPQSFIYFQTLLADYLFIQMF